MSHIRTPPEQKYWPAAEGVDSTDYHQVLQLGLAGQSGEDDTGRTIS